MTLTELLDCDAAKLASFTDAQLLEWFAPMLPKTRPEQVKRVTSGSTSIDSLGSKEEINSLRIKIKKLKAMGVDVDENDYIRKYFKKK